MTPVPGPIILLGLPLLAAAGTYLVRRWALVASFIAALTTGALAYLCVRLPLDQSAFILGQEVAFGRPVVILGRNLILQPAGQAWLAFVLVLATILYLFAWRISQGRSFYTFSLVILSLYALVTLLQSFSLSVIVLAISTAIAVLIIQGGIQQTTRGAQRYLLVMLLAVPFLLAASWLADQYLLDPTKAEMARYSLLPAALGFGLLMAVFPFGTWMPALAADSPPIVTAFVFAGGQSLALYLALVFADYAPWVMSMPSTATIILLSGLIMALSGGVMAAVQRDFGRLFGYAALSDLGILLLASVSGGSQGLTLALLHMINRATSITLLAMALAIFRHRASTDSFAGLKGLARRLPIATLGLMMGGLGLAGFPLTAEFPTRWAVSRGILNIVQPISESGQMLSLLDMLSPEQGPWLWIATLAALLCSSVGIIIGLLRGLNSMLGPASDREVAGQPVVASVMMLALAACAILLGLFPQLLLEPVRAAAEVFLSF